MPRFAISLYRRGQGRRHLRRAVAALALACAGPAAASEHDTQLWTYATAAGRLAGPVRLDVETVLRFGDDAGGLYEGEFGGMIGYEAAKGVVLWAGYLRVPTYSGGDVVRTEDRFRQQVSADLGALGGGKLSGRLRLEQRLRSDGDDTGFRLRPQVKWSKPLRAGAATALILSHESFIVLNDTDFGQRSGYERMRNFAGLSTPLVAAIKAEFGYLNQYTIRRGAADRMDHVASFTLNYSF